MDISQFLRMLNSSEDDNYVYLRSIEIFLGILSVLGTFIIFFIIILNIKKLTPALELIFYLSIISFFNCVGYLIYYDEGDNSGTRDLKYNDTLCKAQGFIILFTEFSSILVSTCILIHIRLTLVQVKENHKLNWKKRLLILILSFGISLILSLVCLVTDLINSSGKWCWIGEEKKDIIIGIYVIIWIFLIIDFYLCISIFWQKENLIDYEDEIKNRREYAFKLIRYPLISLICWIPATIDRFIMNDQGNAKVLSLYIHVSFNLIHGFLFFVFSANNLEYKRTLIHIYKNCKCCLKDITDESYSDLGDYLAPKLSVADIENKELIK